MFILFSCVTTLANQYSKTLLGKVKIVDLEKKRMHTSRITKGIKKMQKAKRESQLYKKD